MCLNVKRLERLLNDERKIFVASNFPCDAPATCQAIVSRAAVEVQFALYDS